MERTNSLIQVRTENAALLVPGKLDISTSVDKQSRVFRHSLSVRNKCKSATLLISPILECFPDIDTSAQSLLPLTYPDKKAEVDYSREWICAGDEMKNWKYCHCFRLAKEDHVSPSFLLSSRPAAIGLGTAHRVFFTAKLRGKRT